MNDLGFYAVLILSSLGMLFMLMVEKSKKKPAVYLGGAKRQITDAVASAYRKITLVSGLYWVIGFVPSSIALKAGNLGVPVVVFWGWFAVMGVVCLALLPSWYRSMMNKHENVPGGFWGGVCGVVSAMGLVVRGHRSRRRSRCESAVLVTLGLMMTWGLGVVMKQESDPADSRAESWRKKCFSPTGSPGRIIRSCPAMSEIGSSFRL